MHGGVAPTDHGWYQFLLARPELTEVNFWRPGSAGFALLQPGEPFFFKLKAPYNAIGGFGLFARFAPLPVWRAWDIFGQANSTADEHEMLRRLSRLSAARTPMSMDRVIGCIAITQPVFFTPDDWIAAPADWARNIVPGRGYDLTTGEGLRLWSQCLELAARSHHMTVTNEHSLPVLKAAHIRPWKDGGRHEVSNGLPLRRDIHRLFDLGFVTVRPDLRSRSVPRSARLTPDLLRTRRTHDRHGCPPPHRLSSSSTAASAARSCRTRFGRQAQLFT